MIARAVYTLVEAPTPAFRPQVGWTYEVLHQNAHRVVLRALKTADGEHIASVHFTVEATTAEFRDYWSRDLPPRSTPRAKGDA